jgi:hypothetical protein
VIKPYFEPVSVGLALHEELGRLPTHDELNTTLCVKNIRFVAQEQKDDIFENGYEPRIFLKGEVQTRENSWHDFFNALVWHAFPQTKRMINALQYENQRSRYPNKDRLPAENMLTLFDENGAVVLSQNDMLLELIREHQWHELFWRRREEVKRDLRIVIIGHGLYEKCLSPYVGMIAQALLLPARNERSIDTYVSEFLMSHKALTTDLLSPLPILGIPGWWPDNNNENFYANKNYFRSKA